MKLKGKTIQVMPWHVCRECMCVCGVCLCVCVCVRMRGRERESWMDRAFVYREKWK
jgi:hypothetical protein